MRYKDIKNSFLFYLSFVVFMFIFLCTAGELALRIAGIRPFSLSIHSSPPLMQTDSLLGWKLVNGTHKVYKFDTSACFTATINDRGQRIGINQVIDLSQQRLLQIYGCSCTFGFSVSDTETQCYLLQKMLPQYHVENKGVPGYGLSQMYLALQESLIKGDTPQVAIFNYGTLHDSRTFKSKTWGALMSSSLPVFSKKDSKLTLPYYEFEKGLPTLTLGEISQSSGFWPCVDKSALITFANMIYLYKSDDYLQNNFHYTAFQTILMILNFCRSNNVIPIIAFLDNGETISEIGSDISTELKKQGYFTLDYGINFNDKGYNCGPEDPTHPNSLAHKIYADRIFQLFDSLHFEKTKCNTKK